MTSQPEELHELMRLACAFEQETLKRAWTAFKQGGPERPYVALNQLMHLCDRENGFGCRACESTASAWQCIWGALRVEIASPDDTASHNSPYKSVILLPAAWQYLGELMKWAQRFVGEAGEAALAICVCCGQQVTSHIGILAQDFGDHLERHRDRIRGAVLGLAAGDRIGAVVDLLVAMVDARTSPRRMTLSATEQQYQDWINQTSFSAQMAGFEESPDSSVGACLSAVIALDPAVGSKTDVENLSRRIARHMGCSDIGADAAIVTSVSLRLAADQSFRELIDRARREWSELPEQIDPMVAWVHSRQTSGTVAPLHLRPEAIRTPAFQDLSDDALQVLAAARHFEHISMHLHTALGRVFSWAGGPHPAAIIVGFRMGATNGASKVQSDMLCHIDPSRLARIRDAAEKLTDLWVPPRVLP